MITLTRKDTLFLLFVLVAAGLAAWSASNALANKKILIKFPHSVSINTPKGQGAEKFRELVAARLGTRVEVEVYPSASLMTDDASIEALAFGEIQMIAVPASKLDRLTKKFQVFDLPFLFDDTEAVERFQASPVGRNLLTVLESKGLHGLAFWHNGMKQFGGPKPLLLPEDAVGLKFRIMESDVLQAQILAVGGNPQKMPFAEVYQALQTGAVDAQENTYSNLYSSRFYEVQDYIVETNHGFVSYILVTNMKFWTDLPDDVRSELDEIIAETSHFVNSRAKAMNDIAKQKILDSGQSELLNLTPAQRLAWQKAMAPVWEQFRGDIGEDVMAAAIAAGQSSRDTGATQE